MRACVQRWGIVLFGLCLIAPARAEQTARLEDLERRLLDQDQALQRQQADLEKLQARLAEMEQRLARLEAPAPSGPPAPAAASAPAPPPRVDLEPEELPAVPEEAPDAHVLSREWSRNIRLDGFGAGGFVWPGKDGARPANGFLNYEATINVDAEVWKDVHFFQEVQIVRLAQEEQNFVRPGEVHVDLKDLARSLFGREGAGIGLKLGRVDIPFGNDYLTQDVLDNPLITFSAGYPYGVDEGLVLYGRHAGIGWQVSVLDGHRQQALDDDADKFVSLKLHGTLAKRLDWSASAFRNGKTSRSAWQFGGTFLEPVGARGQVSSAGASPSSRIEAAAYELNASWRLGEGRSVRAQFGRTFVKDAVEEFDRDITYFQLEPRWRLGPRWTLAGRFSAVGTFDRKKGYAFEGKPFAGGEDAFGFDTKALYRWAVGLGFWPNPRTVLKLESSIDDFQVIDQSLLDDGDERRSFFGLLVATKF
jgi:hypothetical protein